MHVRFFLDAIPKPKVVKKSGDYPPLPEFEYDNT
jgi:hypothetical protein